MLTERWIKSSRSASGNCLEARRTSTHVEVRDTKDAAGTTLQFTPTAWAAFITDTVMRDWRRL
jgi:hypothetical protein